MQIKVITKFDCTNTGVTGKFHQDNNTQDAMASWEKARNQQRNFETITQVIGLFTQLENISDVTQSDMTWQFTFSTEFEGVFRNHDSEFGLLYSACQGVPMIINLNEINNIGNTLTPHFNIWFDHC